MEAAALEATMQMVAAGLGTLHERRLAGEVLRLRAQIAERDEQIAAYLRVQEGLEQELVKRNAAIAERDERLRLADELAEAVRSGADNRSSGKVWSALGRYRDAARGAK
jgi:hypothetical protein